ncbi:extracellular calcium-sensing receptor-like [Hypanus sabinus]|uniref:extracellular calcium-sensing receptor-like n=1 Tax=Hypanus sabinus TaxID=79690 RepID=UPI0028C38772|nr:extracellular calcium-sensing receptor-like [Hypanus sabinus]
MCTEQINFDLKEFHLAQTMIFAIEEINNSTKLLPNLTLGYKIYDGCRSEALSMKAVMALISLQDEDPSEATCKSSLRIPAVLADAGFVSTLAETLLTGPFGIPTVRGHVNVLDGPVKLSKSESGLTPLAYVEKIVVFGNSTL